MTNRADQRISRRHFHHATLAAALSYTGGYTLRVPANEDARTTLRLGAIGLFGRHLKFESPRQWVSLHRQWGFRAADCPVAIGAPADEIRSYSQAARRAEIIIAQVGAWSNPISLDPEIRKEGLEKNIQGLQLADEIGAICCVNASGSLGEELKSEHPENLTDATFSLIVDTVRHIIDEVKPRRAFYALEPMPYTYPHSADSYLRLFKAVDRPSFGVQFDPVNLINSPEKYYNTTGVIRDFVRQLGSHINCAHLKDVKMHSQMTVHIDEVCPGTGNLDIANFLRELKRLPHVPILIEHMKSEMEYRKAVDHTRSVAEQISVRL